VRTADNLTTFVCRLSRNLGASTSWNPQGLSRHVMGFIYILPIIIYSKLILSVYVVQVTSVAHLKGSHCSVLKCPNTTFHTQFVDSFMAYLPTKFQAVTSYGSLVIATKRNATYPCFTQSPSCCFTIYQKKTRNRSCIFIENIMKLHDKIQYYV